MLNLSALNWWVVDVVAKGHILTEAPIFRASHDAGVLLN